MHVSNKVLNVYMKSSSQQRELHIEVHAVQNIFREIKDKEKKS